MKNIYSKPQVWALRAEACQMIAKSGDPLGVNNTANNNSTLTNERRNDAWGDLWEQEDK